MNRQGKQKSIHTLIGALTEAESKAFYDEQDTTAHDLDSLLNTFLRKDNDPVRVQLLKEYEAGLPVTGPDGIRKRLGAIDMEFFGRAYFPHYFSRPSPEFHRDLDAIWQQGVLKGRYPLTPKDAKAISRLPGCRRAVAAPRGHAKSTTLTFKGTIQTMQPDVKNKYIKFNRRHKRLIEQLLQFPMGAHDDGPDALEGCRTLAKKVKKFRTLRRSDLIG